MKKLIWTWLFYLVPITLAAQSDEDSILSLSLAEAKAYALENSPVVKNAALDVEAAKKKVWETTAIGLPQINASLSMSYMITAPTFYEQFIKPTLGDAYSKMSPNDRPADSLAFVNEQYEKAIDDMRFSGTVDFTVSQLIFSGAYIVGLQTSKVYKSLSELAVSKSKQDIIESVANTYYLVLITKENKIITDSTLFTMKQLKSDMEKMFQQGFIDETDLDQMNITVGNIQSLSDMLTRQVVLTENLFKYQIGADLTSKLILTENLPALVAINTVEVNLLQGFIAEENVDYKLLDSQAKLMNLNVKLQKSAFLPDIAAFYQHEEVINNKSFTFTPPDLIGLKVSLPLFTSGSRLAKISQAKIGYQKAINTRDHAANGLKMDFENSRSTYLSSNDQFNIAQKNFELAKKIYKRTTIKYRSGMSSSLELTQAQNQYFQAQTAYYTALISYVNAKNKLEKILSKN